MQTVPAAAGNGSGAPAEHAYTAAGTYTVQATATDKDNGTSTTATHTITITAVALQTDPCDATKTALVVGGTSGNDTFVLNPGGNPGEVQVLLAGLTVRWRDHDTLHGGAGNLDRAVAFQFSVPTLVVEGRPGMRTEPFSPDGGTLLTGSGKR